MIKGKEKISEQTPTSTTEWKRYFYELAQLVGFSEVIEEQGEDEVYVGARPLNQDNKLGKLAVGEKFIPKYQEMLKDYPEVFKKYLEYMIVRQAGCVLAEGICYHGAEGSAVVVVAEKLGYSKDEILDLLAIEIVVGYIKERKSFETYIKQVEPVYNQVFWDEFLKKDITQVIHKAISIYEGLTTRASGFERKITVIDSHIHVGNNRQTKYYSFDELEKDLIEADAAGALILAFPEDIYRLTNSAEARIKANQYVLDISKKKKNLYPFYFVWNDYIIPDNLSEYKGIKWHRHPDEPEYDYKNEKYKKFLQKIKDLNFPVLIEEEFSNTVKFIDCNPELTFIIPHMGKLSGGCDKMDIFFDNPRVYFDTSTAPLNEIKRIFEICGAKRIIFGSDVSGTKQPFYNFPRVELEKLNMLNINEQSKKLICSQNIERLIFRGGKI
ncbi:MAG TPA: hypothetical protein DCX95_07295 [Elusimicrobia bacterium]|nr:hypothetical protein [Elusimicrobiota bacterium]